MGKHKVWKEANEGEESSRIQPGCPDQFYTAHFPSEHLSDGGGKVWNEHIVGMEQQKNSFFVFHDFFFPSLEPLWRGGVNSHLNARQPTALVDLCVFGGRWDSRPHVPSQNRPSLSWLRKRLVCQWHLLRFCVSVATGPDSRSGVFSLSWPV